MGHASLGTCISLKTHRRGGLLSCPPAPTAALAVPLTWGTLWGTSAAFTGGHAPRIGGMLGGLHLGIPMSFMVFPGADLARVLGWDRGFSLAITPLHGGFSLPPLSEVAAPIFHTDRRYFRREVG